MASQIQGQHKYISPICFSRPGMFNTFPICFSRSRCNLYAWMMCSHQSMRIIFAIACEYVVACFGEFRIGSYGTQREAVC